MPRSGESLERVDVLERRIVDDAGREHPARVGTDQPNLLRGARVDDELADGLSASFSSDTPTLMNRCLPESVPATDEELRELIRGVHSAPAVAVRAQPGLEFVFWNLAIARSSLTDGTTPCACPSMAPAACSSRLAAAAVQHQYRIERGCV
jgi:hypothetical protein